ncbi:2-amino-4-hydroxy-6-hydroxymethyldihydropteridine diphosphokinase [Roseicyclus persicicus]|uniref:2-amino-4-hydroxy-6-hydroxymethyldihydropteridine pyrophosphokinase n=1 Tax=Roseicyclus persicicus TaxID=2650661 RepID=A0A7X6GWT6_9RHOB|nr:2-amino-4-hydroxy-6-hydroxymethyldihydropteridine diphosphokinase [Roseibacterium persicicum]NKX43013.1 2-amino-4-hydroxy-6-hydroxymethyldihydropteridine diphosphokinase [Roseibacterium persicicum]
MGTYTKGVVAFGANLPSGDLPPARSVAAAMDLLEARAGVPLTRSRLYRTPAFPPGAGPDFVNAAAALDWAGTPEDLLALLHGVEAAFGRTRTARWEARIMDLDLIALGDTVLPDRATQGQWAALPPDEAARATPDRLILPHPRLAERGFVLVPAADVAPEWRHPVTGRTVAEMATALPAAERAAIRPLDPGDGAP